MIITYYHIANFEEDIWTEFNCFHENEARPSRCKKQPTQAWRHTNVERILKLGVKCFQHRNVLLESLELNDQSRSPELVISNHGGGGGGWVFNGLLPFWGVQRKTLTIEHNQEGFWWKAMVNKTIKDYLLSILEHLGNLCYLRAL